MRPVLLASLLVLAAGPAAHGQLPPEALVETADINDGHHSLSARVVSIKTMVGTQLVDYRAIRLGKLTNIVDGANVDLAESPIWRLDLRRLAELQPTEANPIDYAGWFPIPDMNPLNNIPLATGSALPWVDVREHPQVVLGVSLDSRRRLKLEWKNLPIERWYGQTDGQIDVTVVLGFVPGKTGVHGSIDVRVRSGVGGKIDVALLSVSFPELLLDQLKLGAESNGDFDDDVLLSPYGHGYLIPNPTEWLQPTADAQWGPDTFVTDYSPTLLGGERGRTFTYPGDCSTQFLFLYDLIDAEDSNENWIEATGNVIHGYGRRPSRRLGPAAGLYVAAHDPDLNVKRIVHDVIDQGLGDQLRLGIRTFVESASDRLDEMKTPGVAMPGGTLWQRYAQGPFVQTSDFDPKDGGVLTRDPSFRWPVVLEMIPGNWVDAVERYREFFVAESHALHRDTQGNAIRLRDLPESVLPAAHRELIGTVDLLDVTPESPPSAGAPVAVGRADDVRRYLDFLREDWPLYQPTEAGKEVPLYLVTHREGMVEGTGPTPGRAVASAGNDGFDRAPRPLLSKFLFRLRVPEPRWPEKPWEARVLAALPRDHGWLDVNNSILFPGFSAAFRETGHEALLDTDVWLESFARDRAAKNLTDRIERTILTVQARNEEEETLLTQVDHFELGGPGALATPDYAEWIPEWRTSHLPKDDVGGGNAWHERHAEMRRALMQDPVLAEKPPVLGVSTGEFNEAMLQWNLPIGRRTPFPASVLDDDTPKHLSVFAEPVMMTSFLYHDYAILRGTGVTFSRYFAMPAGDVPLGSGLDPRYLDQTLAAERNLGYRLSRHVLARQIVHGGLLSGVGLAAAPGTLFENDAGGDGAVGSYDDRLCTSDGRTAGPFDVAKGGWLANTPPAFARDLLRARSQMPRFFVGGRRVRDPALGDPDDDPHFYADDMQVKRWGALDLSGTITTYHGGDDAAAGGMNIERLVVGTYVDDGVLDDGRRHRLMICVANPSPDQIHYQLTFDPVDWDLPKTEVYALEALDLEAEVIPNFGVIPSVTWSSGQLQLPKTVGGGEPFAKPYEVHFWVLRRVQ